MFVVGLFCVYTSLLLLHPVTEGFSIHPLAKNLLKSETATSWALHVAVDPLKESHSHTNLGGPNKRTPKRSYRLSTDSNRISSNNDNKDKSNFYNRRKQQQQQQQHHAAHKGRDQRRDRRGGPAGLRSAAAIETRLTSSLESLRLALSKQPHDNSNSTTSSSSVLLESVRYFPTVRACNEALAAFGDAGDLLRALRLFGKMRKLAYFQQQLHQRTQQKWILPVPSLVTYSTLMSRAVKQHKPQVALRLWNLMVDQENMCSSSAVILPDVKAANILMNCYAKLADVTRARQLLEDMKTGQILKTAAVPSRRDNNTKEPKQQRHKPPSPESLTPNLVTMNTLLNACQKAGDLDAALACQQEMETLGIRPDARTFTTLIATVARGHSQQSGKNDPSLAFTFLQQMKDQDISPNGMTYSALIDACGRCRRSDLALQGLRMMIRQKAQESKYLSLPTRKYTLPNEVGAWTAAIDACGKSNRLETATKLFYAMDSSFGCPPNTVTCGCLTDSLLRAGRTAETLDVLRYMKRRGMEPSEVMYTSLMTQAERLVEMENNNTQWSSEMAEEIPLLPTTDNGSPQTKAIEVFTELMRSLIDTKPVASKSSPQNNYHSKRQSHSSASLVKVFLVFQQMKASGATPDIACYNALLRACARAGEWDHALRILQELQSLEHLEPNDNSWRELLRAASRLQRSDLAVYAWKLGLAYRRPGTPRNVAASSAAFDEPGNRWIPSVASFSELISAFSKEAFRQNRDNPAERANLLKRVIFYYRAILKNSNNDDSSGVVVDNDEDAMGMSLLNAEDLHDNRHAMLLILKAAVFLRDHYRGESTSQGRSMQQLSTFIVQLPSFTDIRETRLNWSSYQALEKAESWLKQQQSHDGQHEHPYKLRV